MACRARCRTIRGSSRFISAPMPMRPRPPRPKRVVRRGARMLELKSVRGGYGTFQGVFGVSLEVKGGEAVGVIGPNGAGKTTLMRVISGLIRPRAGAISMEGTDVLKTPEHRIVSLGIAHVPENRRLFPRLTVQDNLKMGAFMPEARARYAERLAFVFDLFPRMKERRNQLAGTLSGGEQQMCAIAPALMSDPQLLLLHEPSPAPPPRAAPPLPLPLNPPPHPP